MCKYNGGHWVVKALERDRVTDKYLVVRSEGIQVIASSVYGCTFPFLCT